MNKIIGLVTTWGSEKWISLVIEQALYACDEVIVSVGPHSTIMEKYEDSTLTIAESYGDKIKLVPVSKAGHHSSTKANTMNAMLNHSSLYKEGNWIWLLDDDEFYFKKDIDNIKEIAFKNDYDYIFTKEYFFYINSKHYILQPDGRGRFWKITGQGQFRPTNNWTLPRNKIYHHDAIMFHYSLLMNPFAKADFWATEYSHQQNHKVKWLNEIYLKYDLEDEKKWLDISKEIMGYRHPFALCKDQWKVQENGKLFEYKKEHPEIIESSWVTQIEDHRKIYKPI